MSFQSRTIRPRAPSFDLLLTAHTPITHHDAAVQDDSNRMLFNRQKQFIPRGPAGFGPVQGQIDAVCTDHPVPLDLVPIFDAITFPEFAAAAMTKLFLDCHNSADGAGLFEGVERYTRLEARMRHAGIASPTLRSWWDRLTTALQVPIHRSDLDLPLLRLCALPSLIQQQMLRLFTTDFRSLVAIGRAWHTAVKQQSETYAARAGIAVAASDLARLTFSVDDLPTSDGGHIVAEVPNVSGNSIRHQIVREPAWRHLTERLGLFGTRPGKGPVPAGCEALFYNGGNIEAGAKQPSNVHALAQQVRALYPSLDLLGGVTDSFDLGESRLRVAAWLVCRENRAAFIGTSAEDLPLAQVSIFDLLDDVTLTRQAGETGLGQMIFSFETLCPGAQLLVRLSLTQFTPQLTRGSLFSAVDWFLRDDRTIGGQAARGYGHMAGQWLDELTAEDVEARIAYEQYIDEQRDKLIEGLATGRLGTSALIVS